MLVLLFLIINEVHISSKWKMWNGINGILFRKLFWPTAVRKKMSYSDWAKLLKFEVEGWTYKNFEITQAIYSNRSIQFWNRMIFDLFPLEQLNSNWKKQLWFRNLQEKLANDTFESFIASITDLRAKEQNLPSPN